MSYPDLSKPLEDIGGMESYPDFSIPLSNQEAPQQSSYKPQIQEEFSNPSRMPGFEQLPQQQKQERLAFSQFDPANQSLGGFVPPGTYENPINRLGASVGASLLAPQFRSTLGLAKPLLNALSRVGTGTAANVGYELPELKSKQDITKSAEKNATLNALLEILPAPFRLAAKGAEVMNPLKYTAQKAGTIKNEYDAAVKAQKAAYNPVAQKYNAVAVTNDPAKFLGYTKKDLKYFTPNVTKAYEDFVSAPNFENLHKLQSIMGNEHAKVASNSSKINTSQTLVKARAKATKRAQEFLSRDPEALANYNKGIDLTKNLVEPYRSNKILKQVTQGIKKDFKPEDLQEAIKIGREKVLYGEGKNAVTAIPKSHALVNHLKDLENKIATGKLSQFAIPGLLGGLGGEALSPGFGGGLGIGGGLLAGLGSSKIADLIQNPPLNRLLEDILAPLYYAGGRGYIANKE